MVGSSSKAADMTWLRDAAARFGVSDAVVFAGHVPREDVPAYIRLADLGLSPFPPNAVLSTNSPIKLLEYLAMERPAIGTDIPEQDHVLSRSGGGYAVVHEPEAWSETIVAHFRKSEAEMLAMGRSGRDWLAVHRDYRVLAEHAATALDAVIEGRHAEAGAA
jgi:glycosyltransferase involved in cell wall biosynthesis